MISPEAVERLILTIRDQKVILDGDLAALYGVTTKRLNEQFRRNRKRFPKDFAFQLTTPELADMRSQIATSSPDKSLRSQNATLKLGRGQHRKYRPYAFTEHGPRAVQMSVFESPAVASHPLRLIRAFVKMRVTLLGTRELAKKLAKLEKQLTGRLDTHEVAVVHVLQELMQILNPPPPPPAPPKRRIGFTPEK
ncbi:MAG: ORF6N domain-containing protein [Chthoniobacterales bacterium]